MIIGIVGKRLTGKNEIAEYLSLKYGFHVLDYTKNVLAPLLKKEKKAITRENLINLAMELREEYGNDILTRMIAEHIERDKNYVIAGVRFREEVEFLKKAFGNGFVLIAVDSEPKLRYERAKKRKTKGEGSLSFNRFFKIDRLPTERVIPETMKLADFLIENNGTIEELRKKTDSVMEKITDNKPF
ncbi:MAG: hypothetical protein DRP16_01635 [Candidatus Aenigmatarchaeota archaeon]|nr:MAG: hypothetical protein DRP16_01635 [Candidatus Aenigmarchaeota archaeon]